MCFGRLAQPRRPVLAHQVVIAADAARRRRSPPGPAARTRPTPRASWAGRARPSLGSRISPRTPSTTPPLRVSSLTRWRNLSAIQPTLRPPRAPGATNGSSTPGPVPQVTWKRGTELPWPAGAVAAALGPADDREQAHALRMQPGALLAGGEVDVRLRPLARPVVLRAVEARGAHPVLQREIVGVADAAGGAARANRRGTGRRRTRTPGRPGSAPAPGPAGSRALPASASSAAATSPASPAPTMMTSASPSMWGLSRARGPVGALAHASIPLCAEDEGGARRARMRVKS